jgi:hypothetical protein
MTDRELLELAAKAAGDIHFPLLWVREFYGGLSPVNNRGESWNPLTDDGDAFRLAMKLRIWPDYCGRSETTPAHASAMYKSIKGMRAATRWVHEDYVPEEMFVSSHLHERTQAAYQIERGLIRGFEVAQRRAIVRAAAEIGKAMR